jgi:hypothetical protein
MVFGELLQSPKQIFFNIFDCNEHSLFHTASVTAAIALASDVFARQTIERGPWRFGYDYGRLQQMHIPYHAAHGFRELVTENQCKFIRRFASPSVP